MRTGESARLPSPVLSIHGEREDPHARTQRRRRRRRRGRLGVGAETLKRYVQRWCIPALLRCPRTPGHRRSRRQDPRPLSFPRQRAPGPPCHRHPRDTGQPRGPRFPAGLRCGAGRPARLRRRSTRPVETEETCATSPRTDFKFGSRFEKKKKNPIHYVRTYPHHACKHMAHIFLTHPHIPPVNREHLEHLTKPTQPRLQAPQQRGRAQLRRGAGRAGGTAEGAAAAPAPRVCGAAPSPPSPKPLPCPAGAVMRKLSCGAKYEISRRVRGRPGGGKGKM